MLGLAYFFIQLYIYLIENVSSYFQITHYALYCGKLCWQPLRPDAHPRYHLYQFSLRTNLGWHHKPNGPLICREILYPFCNWKPVTRDFWNSIQAWYSFRCWNKNDVIVTFYHQLWHYRLWIWWCYTQKQKGCHVDCIVITTEIWWWLSKGENRLLHVTNFGK